MTHRTIMRLFIGNLSYDLTEQELRDALAEHEPIVDIRRPLNRDTGQPRGFAFVTFATRESGEHAMKALDGTELKGRTLRVNEAEEREHARHERPPRASVDVDDLKRVDDRPIGPDGKRIRYKGI